MKTSILAKEGLREMLLSEWFFMNGRKLIQQIALNRAHIIFSFEPLHNIYMDISKLLKDYTSTFLAFGF